MQLSVGQKIKFLRLQKNWSQDDLCEKAEITQPTLSTIETGGNYRSSTIEKIAKALEVSVDDLMHENVSVSTEPWKDEAYQILKRENEWLKNLVERLVGSSGAAALSAKLEAALSGDSLLQVLIHDDTCIKMDLHPAKVAS